MSTWRTSLYVYALCTCAAALNAPPEPRRRALVDERKHGDADVSLSNPRASGQSAARSRIVRREEGASMADVHESQKFTPGSYGNLIMLDQPVAYWRLNDPLYLHDNKDDISHTALNNVGTIAGSAADGVISGAPEYQTDGLLHGDTDTALLFSGNENDVVKIPDNPYINSGDFYDARTVEFWFKPTSMTSDNQTIYDEGDGDRGISIYVKKRPGYEEMSDGPGTLYMFMYNRGKDEVQFGGEDGIDWGPISCEIQQGQTYYAALTFLGGNATYPRYEGWYATYSGNDWDVIPCGHAVDLPQYASLRQHSEPPCIGNICGATRYSATKVGPEVGADHAFHGTVDEVAIYNRHLHRNSLNIHAAAGAG